MPGWKIRSDLPFEGHPLDLDKPPLDARIIRKRIAISPQMAQALSRSMNEMCHLLGPLLSQIPDGAEVQISFTLTNVRGAAKVDERSLKLEKK
jgi:hypothetical protein